MSILDIIIFLFFTGGVVVFGCSFFNKKRSSEEIYFGRTFTSGLGCGNVYFRNVCK